MGASGEKRPPWTLGWLKRGSIEFLTIASGGDATVFGDLQLARRLEGGGCASQTRGVFAGGYSPNTNIIEFINISDGNIYGKYFTTITDNIGNLKISCNFCSKTSGTE